MPHWHWPVEASRQHLRNFHYAKDRVLCNLKKQTKNPYLLQPVVLFWKCRGQRPASVIDSFRGRNSVPKMVAMYLGEQSYYNHGSVCEGWWVCAGSWSSWRKISWWPSSSCESWQEWLLILLCLDLKAKYFWKWKMIEDFFLLQGIWSI